MQVIFGVIFLVSSLIACFWVGGHVWERHMIIEDGINANLDANNYSHEVVLGLTSDTVSRTLFGFENLIAL